jgi:hypothetical protein
LKREKAAYPGGFFVAERKRLRLKRHATQAAASL